MCYKTRQAKSVKKRRTLSDICKWICLSKSNEVFFTSPQRFSGDESDEEQGTEQWANAIDRGGLWHINDNTYFIFYLMEEEIRKHLVISSVKMLNS